MVLTAIFSHPYRSANDDIPIFNGDPIGTDPATVRPPLASRIAQLLHSPPRAHPPPRSHYHLRPHPLRTGGARSRIVDHCEWKGGSRSNCHGPAVGQRESGQRMDLHGVHGRRQQSRAQRHRGFQRTGDDRLHRRGQYPRPARPHTGLRYDERELERHAAVLYREGQRHRDDILTYAGGPRRGEHGKPGVTGIVP